MAFKPRQKSKDKFVFEDSFDRPSDVETSEKDTHQEKTINSKKIEIKKYEEMTIEVLNILDRQGIDIYDPNRTPGMYLNKKNKSRVTVKNIINRLSEDNNSAGGLSENQTNKTNIIQFLLNNK